MAVALVVGFVVLVRHVVAHPDSGHRQATPPGADPIVRPGHRQPRLDHRRLAHRARPRRGHRHGGGRGTDDLDATVPRPSSGEGAPVLDDVPAGARRPRSGEPPRPPPGGARRLPPPAGCLRSRAAWVGAPPRRPSSTSTAYSAAPPRSCPRTRLPAAFEIARFSDHEITRAARDETLGRAAGRARSARRARGIERAGDRGSARSWPCCRPGSPPWSAHLSRSWLCWRSLGVLFVAVRVVSELAGDRRIARPERLFELAMRRRPPHARAQAPRPREHPDHRGGAEPDRGRRALLAAPARERHRRGAPERRRRCRPRRSAGRVAGAPTAVGPRSGPTAPQPVDRNGSGLTPGRARRAASTSWRPCDPDHRGGRVTRRRRCSTRSSRWWWASEPVLELVLMGMLANGHVLIEDVPGVAKTLIARSMAQATGLVFSRIQFTPDMLPSDVTGVVGARAGPHRCEFRPGPIFANVVLGDEINRTPPKTQAALLEAMAERQVTIDGVTHALERAVRGAGHAEPDRLRGHLRAARGPARPLPAAHHRSATRPRRRVGACSTVASGAAPTRSALDAGDRSRRRCWPCRRRSSRCR